MTRGVKCNMQPLPTYDDMLHKVVELKQQVANLEEYMLKGVAFRDELQAELKQLREAENGLWSVIQLMEKFIPGSEEGFAIKDCIAIEKHRRAKEG